MRPLGPRAGRSARRAVYRARYTAHLTSGRWRRRREEWLAEEQRRTGAPPVCVVCHRPWDLADDLHHNSYARLGRERHGDLLPMCRGCHEALHVILDRSPAWRAMPRPAATTGIVARLRELRTAATGAGCAADCSHRHRS